MSLTCFCQNSRLCDGEEDVCEGQDDVCFTQVSRDGVYESACRTVGSADFLARLAADCLNGTISIGATILCCNDRDRCNEDLRPTLQPNSNTGSSSSTTIAGPGPRATGTYSGINMDHITDFFRALFAAIQIHNLPSLF